MAARDAIVSRKIELQDILCEAPKLILDTAEQKKLITHRENRNLTNMNKASPEDQICGLVDMIIGKGEKTCKAFLDILQNDPVIKETFTKLEEIQWDGNAGGVHNKEQEAVCDDQYKLTSKPTGLCLLVNNEKFHDSPPRAGTNQDAVDLARTFSWLGFRVLMFKDQTKSQMEETLKLLSSLENLAELQMYGRVQEWSGDEFVRQNFNVADTPQHGDAFVCCVMSHGDKGGVFGTDWERLSIDDITTTFNGVKCPLLDKKPKVFFIQACQKERKGQPGGQANNSAEADATPSQMVVKAEADFLVAMSTVGNYASNRHTINGTWFMQCLWKRLRELCPRGVDLMTILYQVNDDVAQKGASGAEQMPEAKKVTLRKKLVFTPISN